MLTCSEIGLLAIPIVIAGAAIRRSILQQRQTQSEQEKHDAGGQKQSQTSDERQDTVWHAISARIHAIGEHLDAQNQEQSRQDSKRNAREYKMLIVVGLTAVFALASDWIFYNQLAEMREDRRPWVSIEDMKLVGPLVKVAGGGGINVGFALKNVGRSPATNTTIFLYAYSGDENPVMAQKRVCNQSVGDGMFSAMNGVWRIDRQNYGDLIFPGETRELTHGAGFSLPTNPASLYGVVILGCVLYRFSPNGEIHRTGFIWALQAVEHFDDKGTRIFTINGDVVPSSQLIFFKQGMGDFAD